MRTMKKYPFLDRQCKVFWSHASLKTSLKTTLLSVRSISQESKTNHTSKHDGAQVCELIGIYMLYLKGKQYNSKDIGLYRDDGLAVLKNVSEPASEKTENIYNICLSKKTCK